MTAAVTTTYDGETELSTAYDRSPLPALGYDFAPGFTASEKESRSAATDSVLHHFAGLLAAETNSGKESERL